MKKLNNNDILSQKDFDEMFLRDIKKLDDKLCSSILPEVTRLLFLRK